MAADLRPPRAPRPPARFGWYKQRRSQYRTAHSRRIGRCKGGRHCSYPQCRAHSPPRSRCCSA
eukprot:3017649-Rhodomonas_salina.1